MNVRDKIFYLLEEFNSSSEADQYLEDDINATISKYPKLNNLFDKYLAGKLNEIEESELYFIINQSKVLLSALNQYYNEKMSEQVLEKVDKKKEKSFTKAKIYESKKYETLVFINKYKGRLISNLQILSQYQIAQDESENKRILFIKLNTIDYKFIFSIEYSDESFKYIDSIRIIALSYDDKKNFEETCKNEIECKIQVHAGVIPIKLKLNNPILIRDVIKLYSFNYKDDVFTFIQYGNISNESIGYVIEYIDKTKNKNQFENFLKENLQNLFNNHSLVLELLLNNKFVKIVFNDDDILIPFSYELKNNFSEIFDYVLKEFKLS
jgi:hypothetical protein